MIFSGENFSFELGKRTYIMGILNVTKDSFSDGGKYNSPEKALLHTSKMLSEGADIIDIGAQSTGPNSSIITENEELEIIKQYLPLLANEFDSVFSVDTFYPSVAEYALNNGASIINDVSGVFNTDMANLVKKYNCGWIFTHTGGGNSRVVPQYQTSVTEDEILFFDNFIKMCDAFEIPRTNIMMDIGVGFGKSYEHNIEVIKNINKIKREGIALLTALSLKRVVGTATGVDGYDRVFGTVSANTIAILGGTDFIRVHNVKEAMLGAKMADEIIRG